MAKKITIGNQKGGIGKTLISCLVAETLAEKGFNVLMIDLEPQAHATALFKRKYEFTFQENVYSAFKKGDLKSAVVKVADNLSLIPSIENETTHFSDLAKKKSPKKSVSMIKENLSSIEDFDFILFDTPPTAKEVYVQNALMASDYFIALTEMTRDSFESMQHYFEQVQYLRVNFDAKLQMLGILMNRRSDDSEILERLRKEYQFEEKKMYFKTSIYKQTRLEKYTEFGIYNFLASKRPNSPIKLDTWDRQIKETAHSVVDEILGRIEILEKNKQ